MEKSDRNNLRYCRQKVVDDLDVKDVMDKLIEEEILGEEQLEKILAEKTRRAQTRCLLDTLPGRGPRAYSVFVEALEQDYSWLVEELQSGKKIDGKETQDVTQLQELLVKGGVPLPPSYSISRTFELQAIKTGISSLNAGQFLTLHGMPGSGKSVLAAESLRDPEVTLNNFSGGVFWFKVGTVNSDQLLNRMRALCMKLEAPHLPQSIEEAQEILRSLFLSPQYCDSLLILDDVWRPEVIKTFTLPVRVMVTTQDVSVMEVVRDQFSVVEVRAGFTESESMDLFSSYLQVPKTFLPEEAQDIHRECKGSPMVISLIASLISENGRSTQTQRQSGRWGYYLLNLKNRRYSRLKKQHSYEHASVMGAVAMSVDNLEKKDKEKYEKLAVFLDDDPIPARTLEILWEADKYEVEDTMTRFLKKSLAMCEETSSGQESLVYCLHDLQLDYLKNRSIEDPDIERGMHRQFVENYLGGAGSRGYGALENDGYMFSHLAHHLTKAGLDHLFPEIYLDLGFVEANLKATGPVDLLSDYRKYGHLISGRGDENGEVLADFEEFTRTVGAKITANPDADIIQLALREVEVSEVYIAARRLADERPDILYLEWANRSSVQSSNIATILHPGSPLVVKFMPDFRLLTGCESGVGVWDVAAGRVQQRLKGHKAEVTCLSMDLAREDRICSGSEDGTIKIWKPIPPEDVDVIPENKTESLAARRRSVRRIHSPDDENGGQGMFGKKVNRDLSLLTIVVEEDGVLSCCVRPESKQVAAAGRSGNIYIYNMVSGELEHEVLGHKEPVNDLAYDAPGKVLASGSDDCTVRLWTWSGQFLASLNTHDRRVTHVRWLGDTNSLATLSIEQVLVWRSPGTGLLTQKLTRNRASSWTCLAASSTAVAAGTAEDRMVIVWSAENGQVISALPGQTSPVTSLTFSLCGQYLASCSQEMLMVWAVDENVGGQAQLLSLGPPHMTVWQNNAPVTAAPDDMNRMAVLKAGVVKHLSPVEPSPVTVLLLVEDCSQVVFGTSEGSVKKYELSTGAVTELGKHEGAVTCVGVGKKGEVTVSGGVDRMVRIFFHDRPELVCGGDPTGHSEPVRDVKIFHMGVGPTSCRVLSCDLGGRLKVWDPWLEGELVLDIIAGSTQHATCLDIVEKDCGESLAAVAGVLGGVKVVNMATGRSISEVGPSSCPVRIVRFSPDGRLVVTGHDTGTVQYLSTLHASHDLAGSSSSHLSILQIWETNTGNPISAPLTLHSSWVTDLRISSDCSTLVSAGDRLVWWSLPPPTPMSSIQSPTYQGPPGLRRRKLSLPLPRSRRSSGSKSNRESMDVEGLVGLRMENSPVFASPVGSPPSQRDSMSRVATQVDSKQCSPTMDVFRRKLSSHLGCDTTTSLPSSPVGKRKVTKRAPGSSIQKELLQTFDIKGSSVAGRVWVNKEFTQFVTVDDAGILYILDEYIPSTKF